NANANGQPQPPPLPPPPTNGSANDENSSEVEHRKPEKNIVVVWSGPNGAFGGWKPDDDIPYA
ncbi:hypothetical protein FS842_007604, partial [Serendipita sp. 407]